MINWRPIEEYDFNNAPTVALAAFVVPSDYAKQNGSQSFWDYGFGRCWDDKSRKFTGILGGNPSHFADVNQPED